MPIHCPIQIRALSAEEFEERDYRVMGHAYGSQNELGRLCDERVYEAAVSRPWGWRRVSCDGDDGEYSGTGIQLAPLARAD